MKIIEFKLLVAVPDEEDIQNIHDYIDADIGGGTLNEIMSHYTLHEISHQRVPHPDVHKNCDLDRVFDEWYATARGVIGI